MATLATELQMAIISLSCQSPEAYSNLCTVCRSWSEMAASCYFHEVVVSESGRIHWTDFQTISQRHPSAFRKIIVHANISILINPLPKLTHLTLIDVNIFRQQEAFSSFMRFCPSLEYCEMICEGTVFADDIPVFLFCTTLPIFIYD